MTTNETFFFRDKIPFDHLKEAVLPALAQARAARRSLRDLVRGVLDRSGALFDRDVPEGSRFAAVRLAHRDRVATDLSLGVLEKSKAGVFSQFEVQRGLPIQMLMKYFTQNSELWQLNADIRSMVQFRPLNLLQDFSHLGTFDIIFCRNVLIYFDQATKAGIFDRLSRMLEPDGVLALGAAESVVGITNAFKPYPDRRGLYCTNTAPGCAPSAASTLMPQNPPEGGCFGPLRIRRSET